MQAGKVESRGHWRDIGDGFRIVVRSRALLTVLVAWNIVMFGNAAINVAEVVLVKVALESGNIGFGVLVGAGGLGLTIGSFAAGTFVERFGVSWLYGLGISMMALGYSIAAVAPTIAVAVPAVDPGLARKRRGRRLQCAPRPAWRAGRASRPRIHGDHVLELRTARPGDDRGGRAH